MSDFGCRAWKVFEIGHALFSCLPYYVTSRMSTDFENVCALVKNNLIERSIELVLSDVITNH